MQCNLDRTSPPPHLTNSLYSCEANYSVRLYICPITVRPFIQMNLQQNRNIFDFCFLVLFSWFLVFIFCFLFYEKNRKIMQQRLKIIQKKKSLKTETQSTHTSHNTKLKKMNLGGAIVCKALAEVRRMHV